MMESSIEETELKLSKSLSDELEQLFDHYNEMEGRDALRRSAIVKKETMVQIYSNQPQIIWYINSAEN